MTPLGIVEDCLAFVNKLKDGYGYLMAPGFGHVFFPFAVCLRKPSDPPQREWMGATVTARLTHDFPGRNCFWRATSVEYVCASTQPSNEIAEELPAAKRRAPTFL